MLKSTALRGLGLTVLAGSALTVGLNAPTTAAPSNPSSGSAAPAVAEHRVERTLSDSRVKESSGLARSTYARNMLFTHNDSGDTNRIFAVNDAGRTRAVIKVKGASHNDWEDISSGPGRTLWIGDIGDNPRKRAQVVVYKIAEPKNVPSDGRTIEVPSTKYTFSYPDRARDAEALLVHPTTGRLYVISKSETGAGVYRAPAKLSTSSRNKLTKVADAPSKITAGSFAPDGRSIVLGSYTHAYTYSSFGDDPTVVALPKRRQGESLEVNRYGTKVLLGSEGASSPVLEIALPSATAGSTAPAPAPAPAPTPTPTPTPAPTQTPAPAPTCQKAPDYVSDTTLFGASLSSADGSLKEALAKNDKLFGKLPIVRQFDPTVPPAGAWSRRDFLNDRTLVTSFREHPREIVSGQHDAAILDFFRNAPTQKPIFWSYFHEPEPHVANGSFTFAEYRAAWRHVVNLVGSLCRDNLYPTMILTGWTTEPGSKRNWRDYYAGDDYISVVAWDPYNSATSIPTQYKDPSTLYASVLKASKESGKPWGIAETGSALVPGDNGTQRGKWLQKVGAYFKNNGAAWVTYFQSNRDNEFRLFDEPSRSAWEKWVQSSR